jgi:NTE family protein
MPAGKLTRPAKVALALAGGGPEGAIYEIGAVKALEDAIEGLELHRLDAYVGVSAGAFIGSCLANGLSPTQMCRAIVSDQPGEHPFVPGTFFSPAVREYLRGVGRVPRLLSQAVWNTVTNPRDHSLLEGLTRLSRALPVGIFDNEPIRAYLERIFSLEGRTDDFRELGRPLYVVAADLASGKSIRFGEPGLDHIPISTAVQASTALPGVYPPVKIDGRNYVDGVLLKTVHASVALDAGADLVICINPLVPVDTKRAVQEGLISDRRLVGRGLPTVLSQTFRTLIHSRMKAGFQSYGDRYKGRDLVLFEPGRDDYTMAFGNVFRFSTRQAVCSHAYRTTLESLRQRQDELGPIFARYGLRLREEVLAAPDIDLWEAIGGNSKGPRSASMVELESVLDRLDDLVALQSN